MIRLALKGAGFTSICEAGNGTDGLTLVPEDCQPRLFERFYRVDKDRSRALGGTGLGLAIVKHIAQRHGGQAAVSSKPGEGATFTLVI